MWVDVYLLMAARILLIVSSIYDVATEGSNVPKGKGISP
jgi:hypothetical protein